MEQPDRAEGGHIVVDGATGFLGTHLTHKLINSGFAVKCIVHPGANRKDAEQLRKLGAQIYIGSLDENDEKSPVLATAFGGAVAAVHLIGSVAPKKGEKLQDLHVTQTEWFAYHAQVGKVGRIIMVTTLGTAQNAQTVYQSSKWEAEEVVRQAPIPYTILRPALMVGREVGTRDSKLVKRYIEMIEKKAFVPVIAGGHARVQPIFVGDVVNAICRCIFPG
ncbi:MAG: NAD-dependent epimerase/dehydratase family protein, partial [Terriglobales bacterium]